MESEEEKILIKSNTEKGYEEAEIGDSINYSVPSSKTRRGRVGKGKAQTLDTGTNQAVIVAMRGRNPENPSDRTTGAETEQRLEANTSGNTNCITGVQKDNLVAIPGTWRTHHDGRGFREIKSGNCTAVPARGREDAGGQNVLKIGSNIRRLTEVECARLQGFPDNWNEFGNYDGVIKKVPKTQRYKQFGNAVTVDMVRIIGERLIKNFE